MFEKRLTQGVSFVSDFLLAILLLIAAFSYLMVFESTFVPDLYQARDIQYATGILGGHFVWFGPDLTGGGKIPGSFYYWLLSLPIGLFGTWKATYYFCYFLASAAVTILWFQMRQNYSGLTAWFSYVLFLTSFSVVLNLGSFWNPSYLYIFQILVLLSLDKKEFKSPIQLFGGAVLLGLSLQIHLTQIIFLLAACGVLFCREEKSRRVQNFVIFLLGLLVTLLPYLIWRVSVSDEPDIFKQFLAGGNTFLKPMWMFISNPLEWGRAWFESLFTYIKQSAVLELTMIPGLLVFFFHRAPFTQVSLFFKIAFTTSIGLFFWVGFQAGLDRYLVPFYLLLILLVAVQLGDIFSRPLSKKALFLGLCFILIQVARIFFVDSLSLGLRKIDWTYLGILFLSVCLIFYLVFRTRAQVDRWPTFVMIAIAGLHLVFLNSQMSSQDKAKILPPSVMELEKVAQIIFKQTGWSYDELRENTFIQGLDPQSDFSIIFESASSGVSFSNQIASEKLGLIFVWKSERGQIDFQNLPLPSDFFLNANVQNLNCKKEYQEENWYLCFYRRGLAGDKWIRRNNMGYSYRKKQPPLLPIGDRTQVIPKSRNEVTMSVHACDSHEPSCTVFFEMVLLEQSQELVVTVLGDPLGTPDPAPNPAWALQLAQLELEIQCKGPSSVFQVASHLGFKGDRRTYLAPYDAVFKSPCGRPESVIIRGRGESVFHNYFHKPLEPFRLQWDPT